MKLKNPVRISVTFEGTVFEELKKISAKTLVPLASLIRSAVEKLVSEKKQSR